MSKKTRVNRKSKFKNKLDRKSWRSVYARRPYTAALFTYRWLKNRQKLEILNSEPVTMEND